MNELEKILAEKRTENGDVAFNTTGNNLTDLFFMTAYFEKHLDQVKIGNSEKEKVFSMFVRDSRFGLGRRALGRKLMELSGVSPKNIVLAGRFDDLLYIPTDINLQFLREQAKTNDLAKKWLPRLTSSKKMRLLAKALCKEWGMTEKEYRKLIKTDTTEYKLSYAEKSDEGTPLNELFKQGIYTHPLVNKIDFEKVPSLAMTKYLHCFSTREDIKDRFSEYIEAVKENKAKLNVATANVHDSHKTAVKNTESVFESEASEIVARKIEDNATLGVEINAIPILDTSGSMYYGWGRNVEKIGEKATSVAHAIAKKSTYAPNQVISFSSKPKLITIKGSTLKEEYESMYTGDCSNTDFGKVMELLRGLKRFPDYLVVLTDMEFDEGSRQNKEDTMTLFKQAGANTRIIWWNFNDRNKTVPEFDEYGNIYLSGYNLQLLKLLENNFDMTKFIDKALEKYKKDIDYKCE